MSSKTSSRLKLLVLLGLVLLVWGRHLSAGFVYDDLSLIQANPRVTGTASWSAALTGSFWGFAEANAEGAVGYWRPLTVLVLRLTYAISASALAFHLVSLGLHLIAVVLARRLAGAWLRSASWAWLAAAVFAVHPLQVEPVAWAAALSDVLVGLFSLAALLGLTRYLESRSPRALVSCCVCFLAALLSKEQALFLVPVFVLVARLPLATDTHDQAEPAGRGVGLVCAGLFAMLAVYVLARGFVFGDWLAGFDRANSELGLSGARAIVFRLEAFGTFVAMLLGLEGSNPFRGVAPTTVWTAFGLWLALACVAAWGFVAWKARRSRLAQLVVWSVPLGFAAVLIAPNSAGQFPVSDRYAYLTVFFAGVGFAAWLRACSLATVPRWDAARLQWVGRAVVLILALVAALQVPRWQSDTALFRSAVTKNPGDPFVHWSLGRALLDRYRADADLDELHAATMHFLVSRSIGRAGYQDALWQDNELDFKTRANGYRMWLAQGAGADTGSVWRGANDLLQAQLGQAYCELELALLAGQAPDEATRLFRLTLMQFPGDTRAELGVANALYATALLRGGAAARALCDEARDHARRARTINPAMPETWQLEVKLGMQLDDAAAIEQGLARLTELTGPPLDLVLEVARWHANAGDAPAALAQLARIPNDAPEFRDAEYVRAVVQAQTGAPEAALATLEALLAADPQFVNAYLTAAQIHLGRGDLDAALKVYREAVSVAPDSFEAHYGLATLLKETSGSDLTEALIAAYRLSLPGDSRRALAAELKQRTDLTPAHLQQLLALAERFGEARDIADWRRMQAPSMGPTQK